MAGSSSSAAACSSYRCIDDDREAARQPAAGKHRVRTVTTAFEDCAQVLGRALDSDRYKYTTRKALRHDAATYAMETAKEVVVAVAGSDDRVGRDTPALAARKILAYLEAVGDATAPFGHDRLDKAISDIASVVEAADASAADAWWAAGADDFHNPLASGAPKARRGSARPAHTGTVGGSDSDTTDDSSCTLDSSDDDISAICDSMKGLSTSSGEELGGSGSGRRRRGRRGSGRSRGRDPRGNPPA